MTGYRISSPTVHTANKKGQLVPQCTFHHFPVKIQLPAMVAAMAAMKATLRAASCNCLGGKKNGEKRWFFLVKNNIHQ